MAAALMSLANKRSRLIVALVFTTFVFFFISRPHGPVAGGLFGGGGRNPAAEEQKAPEYNGPRIELFGIPNFGAEVEVATLNIKVKEQPSSASLPYTQGGPGSSKNPKFGQYPPSVRARQGYGILLPSPLQQQLPIALPKFSTHHVDVPDFNLSDLDANVPGTPPATITLEIPTRQSPPDASKLTFGVATLLERMPDALRNFKHWAAHTDARFVVVHEPQNTTTRPGEPSPDDIRTMYREAGINHLFLIESGASWGERYVSLLSWLSGTLEEQTEWVAMIDDDTFFFDMDTVLGMLKKYDANDPWYVGTLSENKWNINNGGIFAIGGAGIFMSKPLIQALGPHADSCWQDRQTEVMGGDAIIGDCVYAHTTTKLTIEHGLYQLDLHGDVTGFYEAVRPQPVSVHHWKSWHHHDLPTIASVSEACGKHCVLQNFRFQDGWQLANGFSVVKYGYNETELANQHPEAMEHTWKPTIWDIEDSWRYSLEPLKPKDEGKVQFLIEKSVLDEQTETTTIYYVRRENGVGNGLIKMIWHKASS
ncbi:Chondroitin sulfate synthase 1 [Cytospora mali]|uniref:Chondroitin sulfate synthase 1 n=1 Tax=Cytospora mali TaxID=578113 RepID=A0A194W5B6_CYTMA|nr:Chondroitin sulfate synthase 1 [Valsa mali]